MCALVNTGVGQPGDPTEGGPVFYARWHSKLLRGVSAGPPRRSGCSSKAKQAMALRVCHMDLAAKAEYSLVPIPFPRWWLAQSVAPGVGGVTDMSTGSGNNPLMTRVANVSRRWSDPLDQARLAAMMSALDAKYSLSRSAAKEPGVLDIIAQMLGRLARSFPHLSDLRGRTVLDIACGSNTSRMPGSISVNTPFGEVAIGRPSKGYTALFEPWFCRMLIELGATPVGVDFGDLELETFTHYRVDLGKEGALDFLPDHSFDAVQDSRLFGSPEFTSQFPNPADHLRVAQELVRQERRLLKANGIIIHSDAAALLR